MGKPKQLLLLQGQPLVATVLRRLAAVEPDRLIVVLGAGAERIRPYCTDLDTKPSPEIILNPDWSSGLASSIHAAVSALAHSPKPPSHLLIALVDQPYLNTNHYRSLIETSREFPDKIIAASYEDRLGAPMLFPQAFFPQLMELKGDQGAGKWVRTIPDQVISVHLPEAAVDWDTREDLSQPSP